jgi:recombination protein RecT
MKTDGSDYKEKEKNLASPVQSLKDLMNSDYVKRRFIEVMGDKAVAFIASVLSAAQKNTELSKCDPNSVLSAAMVAATLDLPIDSNLGFAAIIPYNSKRKDKNGHEFWVSLAQFQIMYKGFIQLALRSGQYKNINVSPIYEDEFDSYDIITGDIFIHPVDGGFREQENEEKIIGYVAFFRLLNGYERMEYWSLKKIEAHGRKYSKSFDNKSGLWKKDPQAMYAKTVLKNTLSRWGIMSVTMQSAIVADQSVIREFDKPITGENVRYIDANEPSSEEENQEADEAAQAADEKTNPPQKPAENSTPKDTPVTAVSTPPAKPRSALKSQTAANPGNGNPLFPPDEEEAMEEMYDRQMSGSEPPDFS